MRDLCTPFDKRNIVYSSAVNTAYEQAVYHEYVAPSLHLNTDERKVLTSAQKAQFENDAQMKLETTQMQQAMQSDTVASELAQQKAKQEHDNQQEAQRNIEEAVISQEQDKGEIYE
ncbi:hypothetical protein [Vibrio maritimus]|uniref:hypothetical protein n=1 Tax=Vibrio maritimus TaxID=990268 RepID=UPI003AF20009